MLQQGPCSGITTQRFTFHGTTQVCNDPLPKCISMPYSCSLGMIPYSQHGPESHAQCGQILIFQAGRICHLTVYDFSLFSFISMPLIIFFPNTLTLPL